MTRAGSSEVIRATQASRERSSLRKLSISGKAAPELVHPGTFDVLALR